MSSSESHNKEISSAKMTAVLDYMPFDARDRSQFFDSVFEYFKANIPESIQSLLTPQQLKALAGNMRIKLDQDLGEVEADMLPADKRKLVNRNTFIPARCCLMRK